MRWVLALNQVNLAIYSVPMREMLDSTMADHRRA